MPRYALRILTCEWNIKHFHSPKALLNLSKKLSAPSNSALLSMLILFSRNQSITIDIFNYYQLFTTILVIVLLTSRQPVQTQAKSKKLTIFSLFRHQMILWDKEIGLIPTYLTCTFFQITYSVIKFKHVKYSFVFKITMLRHL